jgi:hypothetical protein
MIKRQDLPGGCTSIKMIDLRIVLVCKEHGGRIIGGAVRKSGYGITSFGGEASGSVSYFCLEGSHQM